VYNAFVRSPPRSSDRVTSDEGCNRNAAMGTAEAEVNIAATRVVL
jgi:hypothetical protein